MHVTSGPELREERELAELTQVQLAARMGVGRTVIVRNESKAKVKAGFAQRYRAALREFATEQGAA